LRRSSPESVRALPVRLLCRVGEVALVAVLVVVLTALLVRLTPGDPARGILGERASAASVQQLRVQLGLDRPLLTQIGHTLGDAARGDLGTSLVRRDRGVASIVGEALPITLSLIVGATLISVFVGVPLGLLGAMTSRRRVDRLVNVFSITVLSVPPFVLSLLLLLVLALGLGLAPSGGWGTGWPDNLRYAWVPSLALSGLLMPQVIRTTRQTARELQSQEFVEAAEARGLSPTRVALRHILPNSALPIVTIVGFNAAALLGGAVVVEAVFGIPGFGQVLVDAVQSRDYPVIQGVALASALLVVGLNLLIDVFYSVADPRSRLSGS
jgi:peptide/nickel transport system permease protein